MSKYILLILSFTLLGAFGGYCFKRAISDVPVITKVVFNQFLYIGAALYFVSAVMNIFVLKFLPYTIVLPITSLTYAWTLLISKLLLKERITKYKVTGVLFIISGALLLGYSIS